MMLPPEPVPSVFASTSVPMSRDTENGLAPNLMFDPSRIIAPALPPPSVELVRTLPCRSITGEWNWIWPASPPSRPKECALVATNESTALIPWLPRKIILPPGAGPLVLALIKAPLLNEMILPSIVIAPPIASGIVPELSAESSAPF